MCLTTTSATESTSASGRTPAGTEAPTPREATTTSAARGETTPASWRTSATSSATSHGCTSSTSSSTCTLGLWRSWRGFGFWKELLKWEKLIASDVELVAGFEGGCLDAFSRLDGEVNLIDRSQNLVNLADGCLVLEVDRCVEVGDLSVNRFANNLPFASVQE